jgi:hypothetical protein
MGTVRVSAVRFRSTRLNTLSASPAGGPPVVVAGPTVLLVLPLVEDAAWSSRSLLDALVPHLYINRYIVVRYSDSHKNDIYKKKLKIK